VTAIIEKVSTHVAVLGLGYVGCVSAACLARLGHQITGIDVDEFKVRRIQEGRAPFFEPGLEELVHQGVEGGRLTATTLVDRGLSEADIAFICVGTPSESKGDLGLEQLRRVTTDIARAVKGRVKPLIVAVRSTVFPGTCADVVTPILSGLEGVSIICNPEFLREGSAVRDFMEPSLLVVGGPDAAARRVAALYEALGVQACLVSLQAAEMIKLACNAYHAVKICFANEIGSLAAAMGVSGDEVMATLCRDTKLNVSTAYLRPGFAFGGSCLLKDLRALTYRAGRLDICLPLLESGLPSNDAHLRRAIQNVLDLPPGPIGIFGLAFKENTDDLRESPALTLLTYLAGKGRDVRVFDPHIRIENLYGSNRGYALSTIPNIECLMTPTLEGLLGWAAHLVLAQKPSPPVAAAIARSGLPVLNLCP